MSFLIPVCLYILVPLSQSQGAVYQHTERRWKMGPAFPSCSSRGLPCLLSSYSPQWGALDHLWGPPAATPPTSTLSSECRKVPQPSMFCPGTPAPAVVFQEFSTDSRRDPMSFYVRQQDPLALLSEHTSQPDSGFFYISSVYSPLHGAECCLLSWPVGVSSALGIAPLPNQSLPVEWMKMGLCITYILSTITCHVPS